MQNTMGVRQKSHFVEKLLRNNIDTNVIIW